MHAIALREISRSMGFKRRLSPVGGPAADRRLIVAFHEVSWERRVRSQQHGLPGPVNGKRSRAPTLKKHAHRACEKPASPLKSDTLVY
jgi:hypothetical protein